MILFNENSNMIPTTTGIIRSSFAADPLDMKLGRLRIVAGKKLPGVHVDDVVLYDDIATALEYISSLEEQLDSIGLQKAQHAAGRPEVVSHDPNPKTNRLT